MLGRIEGSELRRVLDAIGTPAFMVAIEPDDRFIIIYGNKALQRATGLSDEELAGHMPDELVPANQVAVVKEHYSRCARSGEAVEFQTLLALPVGERWWRTTITPIFNASGRIVRLMGTTIDVTAERQAHDLLRYQHLLLTVQQDLMPFGILVAAQDGSILNWNTKFRDMWGLTDDLLRQGRHATFPLVLEQLVDPAPYSEKVEELYRNLHESVDGAELKLKDGRTIEWHSRGLIDEKNIVRGRVWFFADVTKDRIAEQRLREAHALQQAILDSAGQIILSVDNDGIIRSFNAAGERLLGYRAEELIGKATPYLFHDMEEIEQRRAEASQALGYELTVDELFHSRARAGEATSWEWHYVRRDGTRFPVELSLTPLLDENGNRTGFMGIVTDISERKASEQRLLELATTDALTKLSNRRHFLEQVDQALRHARRYNEAIAVALIDIDHFKRINDTQGHAAGDTALTAVAARLADALRDSDLICRWGGEEFAALLVHTSHNMAVMVAERLRTAAQNLNLWYDGHPLPITVSIGLSDWCPTETALEKALRRADAALYQAKQSGRNRVQCIWHQDNVTTDKVGQLHA